MGSGGKYDAHAALVECFSKFRVRQSFAETFLLQKRVILADASQVALDTLRAQ